MEIVIPLLVIVAIFVMGLVNKSTQTARDTSASESYPEPNDDDYYPENKGYELPENYSLETIEESKPFSYDDDINNETGSVPMQSLEQENIYNKYMNNRVELSVITPVVVDKNDISNSEIKDADACSHDESVDFDGRKAIIYSEILRPKYTGV